MRIGEVAERAGVNIQTLRYYERRGVLEKPSRQPSGYRDYPPDTARRVRFVKHAQELGFTLGEIQELLRLRDDQTASCADVRARARRRIDDIERKMQSLAAMKSALERLLRSCTRDASVRDCRILEAFDQTTAEKER